MKNVNSAPAATRNYKGGALAPGATQANSPTRTESEPNVAHHASVFGPARFWPVFRIIANAEALVDHIATCLLKTPL